MLYKITDYFGANGLDYKGLNTDLFDLQKIKSLHYSNCLLISTSEMIEHSDVIAITIDEYNRLISEEQQVENLNMPQSVRNAKQLEDMTILLADIIGGAL